jgi:hypothetical protein
MLAPDRKGDRNLRGVIRMTNSVSFEEVFLFPKAYPAPGSFAKPGKPEMARVSSSFRRPPIRDVSSSLRRTV